MFEKTLLAALACVLTLPVTAQTVQKACLPSIQDAAFPGTCIPASTFPTPGALLPIGPEIWVAPTGEVGIGNTAPVCALDVGGDLRAPYRAAFGNEGAFGPGPFYDWLFDLSMRIDDFSGATGWEPMRSFITLDPPIDQVGPDAKYVYSHDIVVQTEKGSDKQFEYIQGPYMLALHEGTEQVNILGGALIGAENNHGKVDLQGGGFLVSVGDWEATTNWNAAAEFQSGHWGASGSIDFDHALYVYEPLINSPLQNHYGIFLENQDVGLNDSYAIYSKGGTTYLEGDLGLGTDTPAAKLDVNGDFVASGTKSFVEPHPFDVTKEIRFVCLEGNEAGTYFRGRAELVGGEAVIHVPEDFALVSEEDGLTIQLTPYGPGADLWVAERGLDRIVVRGARDVEFDYFVNGVRSGYAGFETIRDRASKPSQASTWDVRSPQAQRSRDSRLRRMRED